MRSTANARVAGVWEVKSLRFRLVFALPGCYVGQNLFLLSMFRERQREIHMPPAECP